MAVLQDRRRPVPWLVPQEKSGPKPPEGGHRRSKPVGDVWRPTTCRRLLRGVVDRYHTAAARLHVEIKLSATLNVQLRPGKPGLPGSQHLDRRSNVVDRAYNDAGIDRNLLIRRPNPFGQGRSAAAAGGRSRASGGPADQQLSSPQLCSCRWGICPSHRPAACTTTRAPSMGQGESTERGRIDVGLRLTIRRRIERRRSC